PPIVEIARVLYHSSVYALGLSGRLLSGVGSVLLNVSIVLASPLALVLPIFLYLLSPVIVFFQILLGAFIFTPYAIAVAALQNLYPIYVFVGAAFLFAVTVGLSARVTVDVIRHLLF
ncbi:hypothetical protein OBBRIDRAFT_697030, partial [Obba rivulosa]